jgi:sensor histidine kinase regulating citrate/malate metabolism
MKMIGVPEETHTQLKKLSVATGMLQYRLMQEGLDYIEEKYKETIQKYEAKNERETM